MSDNTPPSMPKVQSARSDHLANSTPQAPYRPLHDTRFDIQQLCKITPNNSDAVAKTYRYRYHGAVPQGADSASTSQTDEESLLLPPLRYGSDGSNLPSIQEVFPYTEFKTADMFKESSPCSVTAEGVSDERQTQSMPDVDHLAKSMQRLRAQSVSGPHHEIKGFPPSWKAPVCERTDEEDYHRIMSTARFAFLHGKPFGKTAILSIQSESNLSEAHEFIPRHETFLPRGTKTDPALVQQVFQNSLDDAGFESLEFSGQSKESPKVGYYGEIMDELKYIAENDHEMVNDLEELVLVDEEVVAFFRRHASQYSCTTPSLLKKALSGMKDALREKKIQEVEKVKLEAKIRKEHHELALKFRALLKSSKPRADAMRELMSLRVDTNLNNEDGKDGRPLPIRSEEVLVQRKQAPNPPTSSQIDDEDPAVVHFLDLAESPKQGTNEYNLAVKKRNSGKFATQLASDHSDVDMEDDGDLFVPCTADFRLTTSRRRAVSRQKEHQQNERRRQQSKTFHPEKHRVVSIDLTIQDRSSPKKKARGTRGVAIPIKREKQRHTSTSIGENTSNLSVKKTEAPVSTDNERGSDTLFVPQTKTPIWTRGMRGIARPIKKDKKRYSSPIRKNISNQSTRKTEHDLPDEARESEFNEVHPTPNKRSLAFKEYPAVTGYHPYHPVAAGYHPLQQGSHGRASRRTARNR